MRWIAIVFVAAMLGACSSSSSSDDSSSDDSNEITSGTIGGLAFTVVDGVVTQEEEDGPITADGEAAIVFDEPLNDLSGLTNVALFIVNALIPDGGYVGPMAYGDTADEFAETMLTAVRREGTDYQWAMFWGVGDDPVESGSFADPVDDPEGVIPVIASFDNTTMPAELTLWDPDTTDNPPGDTCDCEAQFTSGTGGGGVADNGNGDQGGISFENATINSVDIGDVDFISVCP